jgi:hypothetical protein
VTVEQFVHLRDVYAGIQKFRGAGGPERMLPCVDTRARGGDFLSTSLRA